jgi:hypothetical protein
MKKTLLSFLASTHMEIKSKIQIKFSKETLKRMIMVKRA